MSTDAVSLLDKITAECFSYGRQLGEAHIVDGCWGGQAVVLCDRMACFVSLSDFPVLAGVVSAAEQAYRDGYMSARTGGIEYDVTRSEP